MSSLTPTTEANVYGSVRVKYYPTTGGKRVAQIQAFDHPVFRRSGWIERDKPGEDESPEQMFAGEHTDPALLRERALRRAKIAAFDLIACNPDLDAFCTFTFDPSKFDRTSYDDVYKALSIWAGNRVQRRGLKYVLVPEYHETHRDVYGDAIHFHALCTSEALDLVRAISPYDGHPLTEHGRAVYNISSWRYGFSTAMLVKASETDRDKVTKYIYKYMGKQGGQKIGGRYYLHGGDLATPTYKVYDDLSEVDVDLDAAKYNRVSDIDGAGVYSEWSFI